MAPDNCLPRAISPIQSCWTTGQCHYLVVGRACSCFFNTGVGVDERIATQDLTQEGKRGHLSVCLLDEASGSVAAVGSIFPSLLARSTRPATAGINPRIKQDFQDQGLIAKFLPECIKVMAQLGYIGLSSRTLLKGRPQRNLVQICKVWR